VTSFFIPYGDAMPFPAARILDLHTCPFVAPVGGTPIVKSAFTVIIAGMPAARVTDLAACACPPDFTDPIMMGSFTVFTEFMPAARILDPTLKLGMITVGAPNVIIGP
jgi:uncharacterized Zn-binding protein involved in type VI secretion